MKSVYVQTVNNRRRFELNVDDGITATALRQLVASSADLPPDRLKLVLKGKPIIDSDASVSIDHGDTLLALTGPPVPPKYPLPGAEDDISDDEDAVKFQVSQLSSPLARRLAAFLLHTLRFPDEVVDFLFKIRLRTLLAFVIWALVSRVVAAYGWGPVYQGPCTRTGHGPAQEVSCVYPPQLLGSGSSSSRHPTQPLMGIKCILPVWNGTQAQWCSVVRL
eukprot:jgi/Mesvir1/18972/Mv18938-RA.1